ncbi:MAG: hypothetical protein KA144_03600 [Xanthomonadaceae bacterium]|nr:hypothetical protein [Xanthomonadaceae bacterium]
MKFAHVAALICFLAAMALYALSWMPGVFALGLLGACFEVVAWSAYWSAQRSMRSGDHAIVIE